MPDERRRNRSTIGQRSVHQKFSSSFRDTVYQRVDHSLGRRVLSSHLLKTRTSSRPFQPSAIRHGIDVSQRNSCPLLFCPLTPNSHRGDPTETRQSGDANKKNTRGGCFFFFLVLLSMLLLLAALPITWYTDRRRTPLPSPPTILRLRCEQLANGVRLLEDGGR